MERFSGSLRSKELHLYKFARKDLASVFLDCPEVIIFDFLDKTITNR